MFRFSLAIKPPAQYFRHSHFRSSAMAAGAIYCSAFSNNKRPPWTSGLAWHGSMGVRRPEQSRRRNSPGSTDSNFP